MADNYKSNLENYINEISEKYNLDASVQDNKVSVMQPGSMEEAKSLADFWDDVFNDKKDLTKKIQFIYGEKDKELPLSKVKSLLNKMGFSFKPEIEEGKVKTEDVNFESLRLARGYANMIADGKEWKRLKKISENTDNFSANYVLLPKNLCYQVNVPLECIVTTEFKGGEQ